MKMHKKPAILALAVLLLATTLLLSGCGARNENESAAVKAESTASAFRLSNGAKWHMTMNEIRELEKKDGNGATEEEELSKIGWTALYFDNYPLAVFQNAFLSYGFDRKGLEMVSYSVFIDSGDLETSMTYLEGALTARYGASVENNIGEDGFFHSVFLMLCDDGHAEIIYRGWNNDWQKYWECGDTAVRLLTDGSQIMIIYYNRQLELPV